MKLVRIEDDLGILLAPDMIKLLNLDEHTEIIVSPDDDGIHLKPIRFASDAEVDSRTGRIMLEHAETLRKLAL